MNRQERKRRTVHGLSELQAHPLLSLRGEFRMRSLAWRCGHFPRRPAQELKLGCIAPTPKAIEQMQMDGQAAMPGQPGIHGLGERAANLPAVEQHLPALVWPKGS